MLRKSDWLLIVLAGIGIGLIWGYFPRLAHPSVTALARMQERRLPPPLHCTGNEWQSADEAAIITAIDEARAAGRRYVLLDEGDVCYVADPFGLIRRFPDIRILRGTLMAMCAGREADCR